MAAEKILIVAWDNLGDVVMATALIEPLRRHRPGARVGFWAKSYSSRILAGQGLDFVHAADPFWDRSPGRGRGAAGEFLRALAEVRSVRYDTALILNTEWRRSLACALAGVRRRIGFARRKSGLFLNEAVAEPPPGHQTDAHRRLLEAALGRSVPASECLPSLALTPEDRRLGQDWIARRGWKKGRVVLVHPFSGDPLKCWPLPRWMELLRSVAGLDPQIRFAVACSPSEQAVLWPRLGSLPPGLACPVIPLEEVRGLLSQACAFAGGDSGIGHMAAAAGVPVVSLFGPTSPERYAPRGRAAVKVVRKDPLRELGVDAVASELKALLS